MGFGFLAWIVAARLYPVSDVGLASGAVSAVTLCAQLALVGVGSAVITLLPRHAGSPGVLLDTSIAYLALTALVAGGLFVAFAGGFLSELGVVAADPAYSILFMVLAVAGTLGVLFDQASTARRRGDQVLLRGVAAGVVTLAAVAAISLGAATAGSRSIFAAWALGGVATLVLGLILVGRAVPGYRVRVRLDRRLARELTRVGFPNYLLTLAERAPGFVLPIVVTELLSPADNAAWYAAWMMAWVVFVIPVQVGMTSFAEIAREPSVTRRIVRQGVTTSLALGVAGALVLGIAAAPILGLLGPFYAEAAAAPLRVLLLGVVPLTIVQAYFSLGRARHNLREPIVVGSVSSLFSIIVPAAVSGSTGLVGMAVAWLLIQVATALVAGVRLRTLLTQT
jgi:O-antigen/teichoic acid export membrane protein